jgi:hypothetical protein
MSYKIFVKTAKQTTPLDIHIHKDDSMRAIKHKIMKAVPDVAYEEIHLFGRTKAPADTAQYRSHLFDKILQPDLAGDRFRQFVHNYGYTDDEDKDLDTATLEDFLNLDPRRIEYTEYFVGKRFAKHDNVLIPADPFRLIDHVYSNHENPVVAFENDVALSYMDDSDELYIVFAKDVLQKIDTEECVATYFPLLYELEIASLADLAKSKRLTTSVSDNYYKLYDGVDLFYGIAQGGKKPLPYEERGILAFSIVLHPDFKYVLPLDIIFRNIHATKEVPFIKYNPGLRRENMYRLYSEATTKFGEKVPAIGKVAIRLSKEVGKNTQITFFIKQENSLHELYVDLEPNGNINLYGNLNPVLNPEELEAVVKTALDGILFPINRFLQKSGHTLKTIESIRHKNVEIVEIQYKINLRVPEMVDLKKHANWLNCVFDLDHKDAAMMRFKRIPNYREMDAEEMYILGQVQTIQDPREIVENIAAKFDIPTESAQLRFAKFIDSHVQIGGQFVNKRSQIVDHPGYECMMNVEGVDHYLHILCVLKDSVQYVDLISTYFDGYLRASQFPETVSAEYKTRVKQMNKTKIQVAKEKDVVIAKQTTPDVESSFGEELETSVDDTSVVSKDVKPYEFTEDVSVSNLKTESKHPSFGILDEYEDAPLEELEIVDLSPTQLAALEDVDKEPAESSPKRNLFMEEEEEISISPDSQSSGSHSGGGSVQGGGSKSSEDEDDGGYAPFDPRRLEIQRKKLANLRLKDKNSNLFLTKMTKLDPVLFSTTTQGKYKSYSSMCQWSDKRQPIILSPHEKERLDREFPESIEYALRHGSDEKHQNYYVCPKYWCLLTNAPISEEDAKSGKCGGIIEHDAPQLKPGENKYVYEFKDTVPGFLDKRTPEGHCLPCCFNKKWDSEFMASRRKSCKGTAAAQEPAKRPKGDFNKYVISVDTYPIPPGRFGFLPISAQLFLQSDNTKSTTKENSAYLRDNTATLLRYGVEQTSNKSFIGVIADIYASSNKSTIPSIQDMCKIIADAVDLDVFVRAHNGSLFSVFKPADYDADAIEYAKYETTRFLQTLKLRSSDDEQHLNDVIAAYEAFCRFLTDPKSVVQHDYLWDIVSMPNPRLFPTGLNLAILNVLNNDIRTNIELICPTAAYSSIDYDLKKPTVIIVKHDEFYEPVYLFETVPENPVITKRFFEEVAIDNVRYVLKIIRNSIKNFCAPLPSMPKTYEFKQGIRADDLRLAILRLKYKIVKQVLNYQHKTVAIFADIGQQGQGPKKIYLPCIPSAVLPSIESVYMDNAMLWDGYQETRDALNKVYRESKGAIPCKPVIRVLEDGLVVGIVTETNQFLMLDKPNENVHDDGLRPIGGENYVLAEKAMAANPRPDAKRVRMIKMIDLETQFYSVFRFIVKILLNQHDHLSQKKEVLQIIRETKYLYKDKWAKMIALLHALCDKYVDFIEYEEAVLMSMGEIGLCFQDSGESASYCFVSGKSKRMLFPAKHLLSGHDNRRVYFGRMADELLRYKRIQGFMLDAKSYLNIHNTDYMLDPTEMILLESFMTSEYIGALEPHGTRYTSTAYEMAHPVITQTYDATVSQTQQDKYGDLTHSDRGAAEKDAMEIECIKEEGEIVGNHSSYWRRVFPKKMPEVFLYGTPACSYYPLLYIFKQVYNKSISIENVKVALTNAYRGFVKSDSQQAKILRILSNQGKKEMIDRIQRGEQDFDTMVMSDTYHLTNFDLWIFCHTAKLPVVLFCSTKLKHMFDGSEVDEFQWLRLGKNANMPNKYFFIRAPTEPNKRGNYILEYSMLKQAVQVDQLDKEFARLLMDDSTPQNKSIEAFF